MKSIDKIHYKCYNTKYYRYPYRVQGGLSEQAKFVHIYGSKYRLGIQYRN